METTSSEILDIVDIDDRVIGTGTRGDTMQKDQCAGMWDTSCAGHVESGDNYQDTVPRELQEELGLDLKTSSTETVRELFKMNPTEDNGHEFAMVYAIDHQGPFTAAEDEIDELRWFPFAEIDRWIEELSGAQEKKSQDLTSGFIEIWSRFREVDG